MVLAAFLGIVFWDFVFSYGSQSPIAAVSAAQQLSRSDPLAVRDEIVAALSRIDHAEQRRLLSRLACTYAAPGDAALFAACMSVTPTLGTVRRIAAQFEAHASGDRGRVDESVDNGTPWCLRPSPTVVACPRHNRTHRARSTLCHQHPSQPVTLDNITHAHLVAPHHVRLQIVGGRVSLLPPPSSASHVRFGVTDAALGPLRVYLKTLAAVMQRYKHLPDVDVVLNPLDSTPPWPALNQHAGHHRQWRVDGEVRGLDPFVIPSHEEPWAERQAPPPTDSKWAARRSVAAWRGSNTGFARTSIASWSGNMRARLSVLSRMYPGDVDAAITAWPQGHGGNLSVLKHFLRAAPRVKPDYFRRFKYVVDVDGNVQSNRFREIMTHDAIVLKATSFASAYAPSLDALPHVIRVKPDLSDLIPTIRCLQRHDAATLRALHRGMAAAKSLLSHENVLAYWADLIEHYAALQTFTPQVDTRAVPASRLLSWFDAG